MHDFERYEDRVAVIIMRYYQGAEPLDPGLTLLIASESFAEFAAADTGVSLEEMAAMALTALQSGR